MQQQILFLHILSFKIMAAGKIVITKMKFKNIIEAANTPKALIGIAGLNMLAANATAVVLAVTIMALTALFQVYASLFSNVSKILGLTFSLCLQAS